MKATDFPDFRKGDVLLRKPRKAPDGSTIVCETDVITLLEDPNREEAARVRTPAEGTLLVKASYVGDREKINGRWVIQTKHGLFDNYYILRSYELKGGQPSLI